MWSDACSEISAMCTSKMPLLCFDIERIMTPSDYSTEPWSEFWEVWRWPCSLLLAEGSLERCFDDDWEERAFITGLEFVVVFGLYNFFKGFFSLLSFDSFTDLLSFESFVKLILLPSLLSLVLLSSLELPFDSLI